MQILFSFSYNPETKEAAMTGNIPAPQALQILQQLVIAEAVRKAGEAGKKEEEKEEAKGDGKP